MSLFSTNLLSDFSRIRQQVTENPADYQARIVELSLLKQLKQRAVQGDAMAQFRLAQAYPENSAPYRKWMKAAAMQGITNAMLELSKILLASQPASNIREAASYITTILHSRDSFMKVQANKLLRENPSLQDIVEREMKTCTSGRCSRIGFFAASIPDTADNAVEDALVDTPSCV